jgi:phosphoribosylamine--glycine ligase
MLRLKSDLVPLLFATCDGTLKEQKAEWHDDVTLCVVMAAKGYPGKYAKGSEIRGLDAAGTGVEIFHAGTKRDGKRILADGGRVLGVTARGETIGDAQKRAYAAVDKIDWPDGFCRRDIGWRAISDDVS